MDEAIHCFFLTLLILFSVSEKGSSPWAGFGSDSLQNWRALRPQTVVRQVRVAQGSGSGMGAIQQVKVSVQPQSPDLLQFSRAVDKDNGKDGGKRQPQDEGELVQLLSSRRLQSESDGASVWQLSAQLGSHHIHGVVSLFPRSGGDGLGSGLQADVWLEGRLAQDPTQRTFWLPLASSVSYSTNSRQAIIISFKSLNSELTSCYGCSKGKAGQGGILRSPMPGRVVKLSVGDGDKVTRGQTLLVLEAMKMEHVITAQCDG